MSAPAQPSIAKIAASNASNNKTRGRKVLVRRSISKSSSLGVDSNTNVTNGTSATTDAAANRSSRSPPPLKSLVSPSDRTTRRTRRMMVARPVARGQKIDMGNGAVVTPVPNVSKSNLKINTHTDTDDYGDTTDDASIERYHSRPLSTDVHHRLHQHQLQRGDSPTFRMVPESVAQYAASPKSKSNRSPMWTASPKSPKSHPQFVHSAAQASPSPAQSMQPQPQPQLAAKTHSARRRDKKTQHRRRADTKHLLPEDQIKISKDERAIARWKQTQREWSKVSQKLASKFGRPQSHLVFSRAEQFRSDKEQNHLMDKATPWEEKSSVSWEMQLRNGARGGDRLISIGNRLQNITCQVKDECERPVVFVRKPGFKPSIPGVNDSSKRKSHRDTAHALIQSRRSKLAKKIEKTQPCDPSILGDLCVQGIDLFAFEHGEAMPISSPAVLNVPTTDEQTQSSRPVSAAQSSRPSSSASHLRRMQALASASSHTSSHSLLQQHAPVLPVQQQAPIKPAGPVIDVSSTNLILHCVPGESSSAYVQLANTGSTVLFYDIHDRDDAKQDDGCKFQVDHRNGCLMPGETKHINVTASASASCYDRIPFLVQAGWNVCVSPAPQNLKSGAITILARATVSQSGTDPVALKKMTMQLQRSLSNLHELVTACAENDTDDSKRLNPSEKAVLFRDYNNSLNLYYSPTVFKHYEDLYHRTEALHAQVSSSAANDDTKDSPTFETTAPWNGSVLNILERIESLPRTHAHEIPQLQAEWDQLMILASKQPATNPVSLSFAKELFTGVLRDTFRAGNEIAAKLGAASGASDLRTELTPIVRKSVVDAVTTMLDNIDNDEPSSAWIEQSRQRSCRPKLAVSIIQNIFDDEYESSELEQEPADQEQEANDDQAEPEQANMPEPSVIAHNGTRLLVAENIVQIFQCNDDAMLVAVAEDNALVWQKLSTHEDVDADIDVDDSNSSRPKMAADRGMTKPHFLADVEARVRTVAIADGFMFVALESGGVYALTAESNYQDAIQVLQSSTQVQFIAASATDALAYIVDTDGNMFITHKYVQEATESVEEHDQENRDEAEDEDEDEEEYFPSVPTFWLGTATPVRPSSADVKSNHLVVQKFAPLAGKRITNLSIGDECAAAICQDGSVFTWGSIAALQSGILVRADPEEESKIDQTKQAGKKANGKSKAKVKPNSAVTTESGDAEDAEPTEAELDRLEGIAYVPTEVPALSPATIKQLVDEAAAAVSEKGSKGSKRKSKSASKQDAAAVAASESDTKSEDPLDSIKDIYVSARACLALTKHGRVLAWGDFTPPTDELVSDEPEVDEKSGSKSKSKSKAKAKGKSKEPELPNYVLATPTLLSGPSVALSEYAKSLVPPATTITADETQSESDSAAAAGDAAAAIQTPTFQLHTIRMNTQDMLYTATAVRTDTNDAVVLRWGAGDQGIFQTPEIVCVASELTANVCSIQSSQFDAVIVSQQCTTV
jgi:MYCBP-associated protein family